MTPAGSSDRHDSVKRDGSMRVLALVTDAYGGTGGIAQYVRDMVEAVAEYPTVSMVTVAPRIVPRDEPPRHPRVRQLDAARSKGAYVSRVLKLATRDEFDLVICGHINLLPIATLAAGLLRRPLVLLTYGAEVWHRKSMIHRYLVARSSVLVSISEFTRDLMLSWAPGSKNKFRIIPNAIDLSRYTPGRPGHDFVERWRLNRWPVLLTLGRMDAAEKAKGFDEVLEAIPTLVAEFPDMVYCAAGDGSDKARLESKAKALGIDARVVFTGYVPEHEKAELFRASTVYVMPSRLEGFGYVILEALATGVPVVASRSDGSREAIRAGQWGLMVDPDSCQELISAIRSAIRCPRVPERSELEYFSPTRFRERTHAMLDTILKQGRDRGSILPFSMPLFNRKAPGFNFPIALPANPEQRDRWQSANRAWWETHPMRYDWHRGIDAPEYSKEYFQEIDRRFFDACRQFMPWKERPFDQLVDYSEIRRMDVLEIGVGCGTHAQLLASHARSFTGIDITGFAVNCTTRRMQEFGIDATIRKMDAEEMDFPDASFDFVWSWGVIHHSANTRKILEEIRRVLKPGGRAVTMVYHRNFWNYYIVSGLIHGVLRGQLFESMSLNEILQRQTDGALARHYTETEWATLVDDLFTVQRSRVYGMKVELLPLKRGAAKSAMEGALPDPVARFFTNSAKMGTFLVSELVRRD